MGKQILGIVGSYRRQHIIDTAVSQVLKAAQANGAEIRKIYLLDKNIEFCTNCRKCTQKEGDIIGKCVHNDDIEQILDEIDRPIILYHKEQQDD